jgi:hypothetical protein
VNDGASGHAVITGQGARLVLGKLVKSGGAGSVYRLRDSATQVAKVYHANQDLAHYEHKITAMLELTPELPDLELDGRRIVQVAWPQTPIRDARGRFLGFLMPAVDIEATSEVECILQEKQARREGLPTGLGPKVTLAANLSAVIAELHRQRHYVVDLKPVNLRFYRQSLYMAMLDCDGFSIQGKGERFEAPQYTPDYLAPEFHARGLTPAGEAQQDRFALAVVIFQLLNFGIHPFTGRPTTEQVPTDIPSRIAGRWYAHGLRPNRALQPVPSSGHAAMPDEIRQMFDRAFESAGSTRPAADEWAHVLRGYAQRSAGKLTVCARNNTHQHFAGNDCAQCGREKLLAGARAAAAAAPSRANQRGTPTTFPGMRLPRSPAARPGRPAPHSNRPPNVPAKLQRRMKLPASATPVPPPGLPRKRAGGRPANWPSPAPMPMSSPYRSSKPPWGNPTPWWMSPTGARFGGLVAILLMLFMAGAWGSYADRAEKRAREEQASQRHAERRREEVARARKSRDDELARRAQDSTLLRRFMMSSNDLDQMRAAVNALADEATRVDAWPLERNLRPLRSAARHRREQWEWVMGAVPPTFRDPGRTGGVEFDPNPTRLRTTPLDTGVALAIGWRALGRGQAQVGEQAVLQALWADPDNADAWFALGLLGDEDQGAGAMAVALLLYPSHDAFVARAPAGQRVAEGLGLSPEQFQARIQKGHALAIAIAPKLPQDSVLPGQADMLRIKGVWNPAGAPAPGRGN